MSRPWKWVKWIIVGFALAIGLLLLVAVILNWRAGRDVEKRLQAIREAGDPVTFADLIPAPVDPAENAATYLLRASKEADAIERELEPLFNDESYYHADSRKPTDAGAELARAALRAHPEVIPLLMKAVQASLAMLRIGRLCEAEPLLVDYLVSTAIRGMGCDSIDLAIQFGPISDTSRQLIEAELAAQDDMSGFESALKTERVFFVSHFRWELRPRTRYMPRFVLNESDGLDLFDAEITIATKPRYQVSSELVALQTQPKERRFLGSAVLAQMLIPALQAARDAADRARAQMRCIRVLVALQAFLEKQPGVAPSLDKLGVASQATIDPYTGKPLRLKQTDDGWLVYSVGGNLIDDGGALSTAKDVGAGPVK